MRRSKTQYLIPTLKSMLMFHNGTDGAAGGGGDPSAPATPAADAGGAGGAGGAGTPPTATGGEGTPPEPSELAKAFGDAYNADLLKDIKTPADMIKAFTDAKDLAAKALTFPGADATDDQKKAFNDQYRSAMVPADAKSYGLTKPEGLAPELDNLFSDEGLGQFADVAHKIGLTKDQATALMAFDRQRSESLMAQATQAAQARETQFMDTFRKQHGANAEKVLDTGVNIISKHGSEADIANIAGAPEAARMAFANVLNNVAKAYIGEDSLGSGVGGCGAGKSINELQGELRDIIASDAYRNDFHADHKSSHDRSKAISQEIKRLSAAAK